MDEVSGKKARVVFLIAVCVHILPRGPIEAMLLVPRSDMLQGIQMYTSTRGLGPSHHMSDKAVTVAETSILGVYSNIIHIPIPMVAFMKRNNGEPYQISSAKQPDTLIQGPVAP